MERISTHQFMMLSASLILGTHYLALPFLTSNLGRDAWMVLLPAFIWSMPLILMILSMVKKYPGKNFIDISETLLGKWVAKGLGLAYFLIVTCFGILQNGMGAGIIRQMILPEHSSYLIYLTGTLFLLYCYYAGIEVFSRFAEIVFPAILLTLLFCAVAIVPRFEEGELYPILENGVMPVFSSSMRLSSLSVGYTVCLIMLLPFLSTGARDYPLMKKGLWQAVFITIAIETTLSLIEILTFGPFERARMSSGLLVLSNMIEVGKTVAGIESILTVIFMGSMILKITSFFFAGMWGLKHVFGAKSNHWSLLLGLLYFVIPLFIREMDFFVLIRSLQVNIVYPFTIAWVVLIWGLDLWLRKKRSYSN